LISDGVF